MTKYRRQLGFEDCNEEYRAFVDKFKPKKTTDDCYTPKEVFDCVANWAARKYGFPLSSIVRPFWPGGDYQAFDYPDGCVVLDNPPFSILAKIVDFYQAHGVRFFLFCPALVITALRPGTTLVAGSCDVTYQNGAKVRTNFITNLSPEIAAEGAPDLHEKVAEICARLRKEKAKNVRKVALPPQIITAARLGWICEKGVKLSIPRKSARIVRKCNGYAVFGGAFLLSRKLAAERAAAERAAAERAAAEKIELGEDELRILEDLGDD